ncbi:hypothetical protein [Sorangium cellulosum]|uniref:Uncharacterized protein n=1 Tax=Sorangium cellulosum So0157-2 TaxID=1254432 RepID=S4Y4Z2_SORCE|nr:hypothetical protein [Sorangium cellulosum]AGP40482.1 hypothetical protein SCE1572_41860 [Sorangium cellulosum So0157-2]
MRADHEAELRIALTEGLVTRGEAERLRRRERASMHWLGRIAQRDPKLFVLWQLGVRPEAGS